MILIVEDEAISRQALKQLLQISGFQASAVASAEEAKQMVSNGMTPGIALVDVDLPGADGLDLVKWLERVRPTVVPMLLTASEDDRVHHFQTAHPTEFFRKPVNVPSLLARLEQLPTSG